MKLGPCTKLSDFLHCMHCSPSQYWARGLRRFKGSQVDHIKKCQGIHGRSLLRQGFLNLSMCHRVMSTMPTREIFVGNLSRGEKEEQEKGLQSAWRVPTNIVSSSGLTNITGQSGPLVEVGWQYRIVFWLIPSSLLLCPSTATIIVFLSPLLWMQVGYYDISCTASN